MFSAHRVVCVGQGEAGLHLGLQIPLPRLAPGGHGRGAALQTRHGEQEDGVGVGAPRRVLAHPLLRLQGLAAWE